LPKGGREIFEELRNFDRRDVKDLRENRDADQIAKLAKLPNFFWGIF
jgi:hypothetical protein